MSAEERRSEIVSLIRAEAKVSVDELADRLAASRETIRRDLTELDRRGLLRKIHGGAIVPEPGMAHRLEGPFPARMAENLKAKRAIARRAAALFKPGDSLYIDTGTTTLVFAEELAASSGLTVVTNSAAVAALASKGLENQVFLIGGEYRRGGQECVGEAAVAQISHFRVTHAVLTVAAITQYGFLDHDAREAEVARAMARQAAEVTILADSSKMDRHGLFQVGPPQMASRLVTDALPDSLRTALETSGVEILLAR